MALKEISKGAKYDKAVAWIKDNPDWTETCPQNAKTVQTSLKLIKTHLIDSKGSLAGSNSNGKTLWNSSITTNDKSKHKLRWSFALKKRFKKTKKFNAEVSLRHFQPTNPSIMMRMLVGFGQYSLTQFPLLILANN
jgi:hypothetical protein